MHIYLDLVRHVLSHGTHKTDRTATGTISVFGHQMRFDLGKGFPLPVSYTHLTLPTIYSV